MAQVVTERIFLLVRTKKKSVQLIRRKLIFRIVD